MKTPAIALAVLLSATGVSAQGAADKEATIRTLIEQLGDPEYDVRKAAEAKLLKRGSAALDALKKSFKSSDDAEIKWRSGRLIRKIEAGETGEKKRPGLSRRRDRGDVERAPGAKSRRRRDPRPMERGEDPLRDAIDRLHGAMNHDGMNDEARKAIREAMQQLQKSMGTRGGVGLFGERFPFPGGFPVGGQGRSVQMQSGPDGVRVEVTETDKDGKKQTKVYEAEDMEAFKKKFPGVLDGKGVKMDFDFDLDRGGVVGPFEKLRPRGLRPRLRRDAEAPPAAGSGKKLGFYVGELAPAVRDYLGLKAGHGLLVDSVVEGTLADQLGMRRGDVVTRVGKSKVGSPEDVSEALAEIEKEADVTVDVIRKGRELTLRQGKKPVKPAEKPGAKSDRRLKKRER